MISQSQISTQKSLSEYKIQIQQVYILLNHPNRDYTQGTHPGLNDDSRLKIFCTLVPQQRSSFYLSLMHWHNFCHHDWCARSENLSEGFLKRLLYPCLKSIWWFYCTKWCFKDEDAVMMWNGCVYWKVGILV